MRSGDSLGGRGLWIYLALAAAILVVLMKDFLLFRAAYLYIDVGVDPITAYYPHLRNLFASLRDGGLPGWSFNKGLGQNVYPFSWNDPFLLIMLPFRGRGLPFGYAYREAAKILAAGAFFFLYLRELALREKTALAGAVLFSFSGYVVLGSAWGVFSTEAVYCAFLLFAFERRLTRGSWVWIPPAVGLLALFQPFLLYPYALFLAAYAAFRFVERRGWRPRELASFLLELAGPAALGLALSAAMSLSELREMLESPRAGGPASLFRVLAARPILAPADSAQAASALLRLYSPNLQGAGARFSGWQNYLEAPLFYCGLVCLLLVPQAFAAADRKRRRLYGACAAIALLPVAFPYFRYAFWAFTGDYYRTLSLFVAVVLLLLSLRALDRIEETSRVHKTALAVSLAAALALLYAVPAATGTSVDRAVQAGAACFLIGHAALLILMGSKRWTRLAGTGLVAFICVEAAWASWPTIRARDFLSAEQLAARIGYNDYTVEAVAHLKANDPSFFRLEKAYSIGLNDAQAQGYYGTSSYDSFNQPAYVAFLAEAGVLDPADEGATRWNEGLRSRGKLMSLASVKYFLYKDASKVPPVLAKERMGTFGDVSVYRNPRALPLGFTYDRCLPLEEFRALDLPGRDAALLEAFVAADAGSCLGFPRFPAETLDRGDAGYDAAVRARSADALSITSRSQNAIAGDISPRARKLLFFSIPYDAGWSARVDGAPVPLARVDVGFMGLPLKPGPHRVELDYAPPLRAAGAGVSLAALGLYGWLLARRRSARTRSSIGA